MSAAHHSARNPPAVTDHIAITDARRSLGSARARGSTSFSLFVGDGFWTLLVGLRLGTRAGPTLPLVIPLLCALTWAPTALLSIVAGADAYLASGQGFFYDYASYVQFFVTIPLFAFGEVHINRRIQGAYAHLSDTGIVSAADLERLETTQRRISSIARRRVPDVLCVVAGYVLTWTWLASEISNGRSTWHATYDGLAERITLAGMWAGLVSVPLLNAWICRWIWKTALWYSLLWSVSRFQLDIRPEHPDETGGLAFLSRIQASFAFLLFAIGVLVAATVSYKLTMEQDRVAAFGVWMPVLGFVLLAPLTFTAPLMLFTGQLAQAKERALIAFSQETYSVSVLPRRSPPESNWVSTEELATQDELSKHADLIAVFNVVKSMRIVPFDLRSSTQLFSAAAAPMIPLFLRAIPAPEPLRRFLDLIF